MNTGVYSTQTRIFELEERIRQLEAENTDLKNQIETTKLVNRAKAVLMRRYRLVEAEAHRLLQKTSMDKRVSLKQLAQQVLEGKEVCPPL